MKELILFSIVVLFIACQNHPHKVASEIEQPSSVRVQTSIPIADLEALACAASLNEEPLDVSQELENPENPGIHYRPPVLTSEMALAQDHSELACTSEITNSGEDESAEPAMEISNSTPAPVSGEEASWEILTRKWEYVAETVSCQDLMAQSENPSCEDSIFMVEDGKFFSSQFDDSLAAL